MGYLEIFKPDLQEFYDRTMKFHDEEISVGDYKGFSGGFGSYAQRGAKKHMLRLRLSGGRIDKEMLAGIVEIVNRFKVDRLKLTTCESIQLHDLEAKDLCEAILPAWEAGMITRGGGGDFPRNVMCSPLSGAEKDEYFDVMPYALELGEYMLGFIKGPKFPRKLKCAFSNGTSNVTHATIRDLGFVANADGTFDIYICGGMGSNPKVGVKVAEHIEPAKILYYAKAMVETFKAHGNYENRGRARTRYMQETLGIEGLKAAFNEKLAEAMNSENIDLDMEKLNAECAAKAAALAAKAAGSDRALGEKLKADKRIYAQKQDGLFAVFYQPVGGLLSPEKTNAIYDAIKDIDQAEIRVTPSEGMYIINLSAAEAQLVLDITDDGARNLFETSVACIGADTCQVGLGNSQDLLRLCVEELRKHDFADGVLPQMHISGCPSSCTGQHSAPIGFRGAVKRTEDGQKPAFAISVGGSDKAGEEKLVMPGTIIAMDDIPKLLVELGDMITADHSTFDKWITGHEDQMNELIAKYA